MTILFITGHPAQIHNFRIVKDLLEKKGHKVLWVSSKKDISFELLKLYGIEYEIMIKPSKRFFSKLRALVVNTRLIRKIIRKHKVDIVVSRVSPFGSLAAYFSRVKHIALADTEISGIYDRVFSKFVNSLITSETYGRQLKKDQIRINSNIELFYLHPTHYTPNRGVVQKLGLKEGERYALLRFVNWQAYHDKGLSGFTDENKVKIVEMLSEHMTVFISSESSLPSEIEPYRIQISYEDMHDVIASSSLFFGEGASMAAEASVLGVPSIFLNDNWSGKANDLQKQGLLYCYQSSKDEQQKSMNKALEIVRNTSNVYKERKEKYLANKIDASSFLCWFIENYPKSRSILDKEPNIMQKFG